MAGTGISWKASRAVAVPRIPHLGIRRLNDLEPRQIGSDQKRGDFRVAAARSGVRAITVKTSAIAPLVM